MVTHFCHGNTLSFCVLAFVLVLSVPRKLIFTLVRLVALLPYSIAGGEGATFGQPPGQPPGHSPDTILLSTTGLNPFCLSFLDPHPTDNMATGYEPTALLIYSYPLPTDTTSCHRTSLHMAEIIPCTLVPPPTSGPTQNSTVPESSPTYPELSASFLFDRVWMRPQNTEYRRISLSAQICRFLSLNCSRTSDYCSRTFCARISNYCSGTFCEFPVWQMLGAQSRPHTDRRTPTWPGSLQT